MNITNVSSAGMRITGTLTVNPVEGVGGTSRRMDCVRTWMSSRNSHSILMSV